MTEAAVFPGAHYNFLQTINCVSPISNSPVLSHFVSHRFHFPAPWWAWWAPMAAGSPTSSTQCAGFWRIQGVRVAGRVDAGRDFQWFRRIGTDVGRASVELIFDNRYLARRRGSGRTTRKFPLNGYCAGMVSPLTTSIIFTYGAGT